MKAAVVREHGGPDRLVFEANFPDPTPGEGDVIVAIANAEVLSVKDFEQSLAKIDKTKTVNVLFRRGDLAQYALIRPGR